MTIKAFPYQKKCVRKMEAFGGRSLLSADMGLGKTPMSLWFMARNKAWPALIVCPASVKYQWQAEVYKFLKVEAVVGEGRKPPKEKFTDKILIINYDIFAFWLPWFWKQEFETLVIDECQCIGNPKAKRTQAIRKLSTSIPHILALSGTPLLNRPIELFPVLNILKPNTFTSRFDFGMKYCNGRETPWGWDFKGASNTLKLNELLTNKCMVRVKKSVIADQLPEKIRQIVPITLSNESEYSRAVKDFIGWLRTQDPGAAYRAANAESLVKAGYLLRLIAKLKLKKTVEWINDHLMEMDEKLVVFAVHKKMVEALHRRIKAKSVMLYGKTSANDKRKAVDAFQNDVDTRVLVGNIKTAGTGLNLTAACNVVFTELSWTPASHLQAEDRCWRIGQKYPVWAHYLIAKRTMEETLCDVLQTKNRNINHIIDGKAPDGNSNIFNEVLALLGK